MTAYDFLAFFVVIFSVLAIMGMAAFAVVELIRGWKDRDR